MKLTRESLKDVDFWKSNGYGLPQYSINDVASKTKDSPKWLHVGAGNIFRAFTAVIQQELLNKKLSDSGIIVCEGFDEEIIDKAYRAFDNLSIVVKLKNTGEIEKTVVGSVVESLKFSEDYNRLIEVFTAPTLQVVSFTITEKGYAVKGHDGKLLSVIESSISEGKVLNGHAIYMITNLCYERYKAGRLPLALVSMDNFSHNGTILKEAVTAIAQYGVAAKFFEDGFLDYLSDEESIYFNWSMIDKITPRPAENVRKKLEEDGLEGMNEIITGRGTYTAAFVNTEEAQYLAIENVFPNGAPPFSEGGVIVSDKETIDKIERMKVCTCLNPLHTVLAVYGCLLGYTSIWSEMKDPLLKKFIEKVGYDEGLPVVVEPGIIKSSDFIKEVIEKRFPNPFLPDTPQRIASDTSKKIPVRFGETLKAYIASGKTDLSNLTFIPLFFAGWLRYLMAIDDNGEVFELSPDPNIETMTKYVEGISLGCKDPVTDKIKHLLSREDIFGVNLYDYNLGEIVEGYFSELIAGRGAVKNTLAKYLK
ncbi:MAG: mannitol dehydrogenase family protein [Spirochaetales bacterium]|nr:mannitol dehydrogenase family protein [Spirochaetales bacterium]